MNKTNTSSVLSALLLVAITLWSACTGNEEPTIKKGDTATGTAVDSAKLKKIFAELDALTAEQGGKGFEAIAEAQGWKTASPTETYGNPNTQ